MLIVILRIFLLLYLTRGYLKGLANDQTPRTNVMPQEVLPGKISMPAAPNTLALQGPVGCGGGDWLSDFQSDHGGTDATLGQDLPKGPLRDIHSFI